MSATPTPIHPTPPRIRLVPTHRQPGRAVALAWILGTAAVGAGCVVEERVDRPAYGDGRIGLATPAPPSQVTALQRPARRRVPATLVLQLEPQTLQAINAPVRTFNLSWAGSGLRGEPGAAEPRRLRVRLSPPTPPNRRSGKSRQPAFREGWIDLPADALTTPGGVVHLARASVDLWLVEPYGNRRSAMLRHGLSRVTLHRDFLDAAAQLRLPAKPAELLWLALQGMTPDQMRAYASLRTRLAPSTVATLFERGVTPQQLAALEARGTVLRGAEVMALLEGGVTMAEVASALDRGVPAEVPTLLAELRPPVMEQPTRRVAEAPAAPRPDRLPSPAATTPVPLPPVPLPPLPQTPVQAQAHAQAPAAVRRNAPPATATAPPAATGLPAATPEPPSAASTGDRPNPRRRVLTAVVPEPDAQPGSSRTRPGANPSAAGREGTVDVSGGVGHSLKLPVATAAAEVPAAATSTTAPQAGETRNTPEGPQAVPARYVTLLQRLGFYDPAEIRRLHDARVEPLMIHRLEKAGLAGLATDDLLAIQATGLRAADAEALNDAGLRPTLTELLSLREAGIDAGFLRAVSDDTFKRLSVRQLLDLHEAGLDAEAIRELRASLAALPVPGSDG